MNKCRWSLIILPSPERQKAMWESNYIKILYFNLMSSQFRNSNNVLGVINQMSCLLIPMFCYLRSSGLFELAEQGVSFFTAESVQTNSWMTGNDLGILIYSLHNIFSDLSHKEAKRCSIQQKIESCTWMCLQDCVSLISERPAVVTTTFRDLPMKVCDQLGETTHWISFVLLVSLTELSFFIKIDIAICIKVLG